MATNSISRKLLCTIFRSNNFKSIQKNGVQLPELFTFTCSSISNRFISKSNRWMNTSTTPTPTSSTIDELNDEITKANVLIESEKIKYKELEDKYKRSLADSENLRTRLTKQIQDQKLFAIQGFCKDLTDIEDILRLAIDSVPKDQISSHKSLKELYEGLVMTEHKLLQVFKRHGLTQLNPLNEKFNPNEHEAVLQKEEEGKESGTVIFVSKIGYKLHDRVIRPAVVGVAK